MNERSSQIRFATAAVIGLLLLQLFRVAGLGSYTLCIEPGGARHVEWSSQSCAMECADAEDRAEQAAADGFIEMATPCVGCTDLTIVSTGLRAHARTIEPPIALPAVTLHVAQPTLQVSSRLASCAECPPRPTGPGTRPLRC